MSNTNHQIAILNQVQSMVIEQANASGTNLSEHFGTVAEFKKFIIGLAFRGLRDAGAEVSEAFDAVCGEGEYEALFTRVTA